MKIVYNRSVDPAFNLALEEQLFYNSRDEYLMLWRNSPSVIIGRNQNAYEEINLDFVEEHAIPVIRRLTGGGAVFHDLGNVNYTFIVNDSGSFNNYEVFCRPVMNALLTLGIHAELSGRNDMLVDGKKFSGNAQCASRGRVMHHGTLLLCSDMNSLSAALKVNPLKIQSKGIKSVRSRVTNLSEHLGREIEPEGFISTLLACMAESTGGSLCELSAEDLTGAEKLRAEKYSTKEWNIGYRKAYSVQKETKLPCGYFDARLNISGGRIAELRLFGDYFINGEVSGLEQDFEGVFYDRESIRSAAEKTDITRLIPGMTPAELAGLLI